MRKFDHIAPVIEKLKWLTVKGKYIFERCISLYKAVNGLYPEWYVKFKIVRENKVSITMEKNKYVKKLKQTLVSKSLLYVDLNCGMIYLIVL